jgi:hypothetical protein
LPDNYSRVASVRDYQYWAPLGILHLFGVLPDIRKTKRQL